MNMHPNGIAPAASHGNKGNKGGKVARAWQHVWDHLDRQSFKDGTELARAAAEQEGIKPDSVMAHLYRMTQDGVIEVRKEPVQTMVTRGGQQTHALRQRRHYRIAR